MLIEYYGLVKTDPAKQKEREERIRAQKEKQAEGRQKKLEEIRDAQKRAQEFREKQQEERRRKLEELKRRETEHRASVEERRKRMMDAENVRFLSFLHFSTCGKNIWHCVIRYHMKLGHVCVLLG